MTILIRGRYVLTSSHVGALRDAAVLTDGETIAEVGPWNGASLRPSGPNAGRAT